MNTRSKYLHEPTCLVHDTGGGVCDCARLPIPRYNAIAAARRVLKARRRKAERLRLRRAEFYFY